MTAFFLPINDYHVVARLHRHHERCLGKGGAATDPEYREGKEMTMTQLVFLTALLAASTGALAGCSTTADSGSQGTVSQEEATEEKAAPM
jgi:hypothetical protein